MNLIRKIIIALVGLSLALLLTVLLLNPESIQQLAFGLITTSGLIRLPVAILIDALILVIVVILVRAERPTRTSSGLIVKAQGAIADVSIESARDRILRAVRAVPEVVSAEAEIRALHGRADVDLEVVVSRESTNLPEKQKEIDRALRQVVNKQLGLQLAGKPHVHLRMNDEKLLAEPEAPALPSAAAPAVPVVVDEPSKPESVDTMSLRQGETGPANNGSTAL